MKHSFAPKTLMVAAFVFVLSFGVGASTVTGQEATPPMDAEGGGNAHPAHIHSGTCENLGDVVFPLNDVAPLEDGASSTESTPVMDNDMVDAGTPPDMEGETDIAASPTVIDDDMVGASTPPDMEGATDIAATPTGMNGDRENVVAESTTILDVSVDDILAGEHAVNVHESAENIQNYIACGDITGTPTDLGHLEIDLQELNDSGFTGRAMLTSNPDGTTTVTVTLMQGEIGMTGTPEASPAA